MVVVVFLVTMFVVVPEAGLDSVWGGMESAKPKHMGFPGGAGAFGWGLFFSLVVATGLSNVGQPAVFQRFFMARSAKTIRDSAVLYAVIIVPLVFLLVYMTFAGIQTVTPNRPDMLFPTMLSKFAPVLAAFFIAGVIAAAMSTVDSLLISLSSMLAIDYVQKLLGYSPTQAQAVRMGRIFIVLVLVVSYLLALRSPQMLATLALLQVGFAGCVIVPLIGVLKWKRASTAGAIAGLIAGPVAVAVTAFYVKSPLGFNQNFWGPAVGIVAFVLVSLVTPAVNDSHQAQFRQALKGS
jgi:SSS family solute:Na+ symporter